MRLTGRAAAGLQKAEAIMKSMAFATYWLMVVAVISGISTDEKTRIAESEAVTGPATYSFHSANCDAVRQSDQLAGVVSVQCATSMEK
jgi:hypothetical protein